VVSVALKKNFGMNSFPMENKTNDPANQEKNQENPKDPPTSRGGPASGRLRARPTSTLFRQNPVNKVRGIEVMGLDRLGLGLTSALI